MQLTAADPPLNCQLCKRLVDYRVDNQAAYPNYFNAPAPSFGDANARLLIVGLAPGVHGANRTGRPFTGDYAGDLLYSTMAKFGFSNDKFNADPNDGLKLKSAMVTNAVRCVPPQNKPTGPEIRTCRPFLVSQIDALKKLKAILCLGRIAHDSTLVALGVKAKEAPFGHGAAHRIKDRGLTLFDSYHCSRYNTNTRRLTTEMFEDVFAAARAEIDKG
ncbi:uracil-DNA glycosylase [Hyphococcus flavus]|uniref:Type-5 uracil-DNA glycosylase n=1 Tax=Hyphococcus flavus TaxID=1866326 RepID=A0AAF0CEP3_9PROT|nr:uracil-DNA glycosylase [Hyphococcus flavus]WDI30524.1 uracil-DNA glycosylase [Hyphococcus flavus]